MITTIDYPGNQKLSLHKIDQIVRNIDAVIIFFDSSQHKSFNKVKKYLEFINNFIRDIPIYLNFTKSDLKSLMSFNQIAHFLIQHQFQKVFFTSSKANFYFKEMIYYITGYLIYIQKNEKISKNTKQNKSKFDLKTLNKISIISIYTQQILSMMKKHSKSTTNQFLENFYKIDDLNYSILLNEN